MIFTAPDGTQFEDRQEYKKYMMKTFYTFTEKNDLQLVKKPGEIDGQPFELQRLSNCEVLLLDHSETVQADFLESCRVFIAASEESVFLRDCSDCTFTVACKQLRTRDCHNCKIFLHCKTDPIIELSDGITFAPFNGAYPDHARHLASAGLDPCMIECWYKVYDFNDPQGGNASGHWRYMTLEEDQAEGIWTPLTPQDCVVDRVHAWSLTPEDNTMNAANVPEEFGMEIGGQLQDPPPPPPPPPSSPPPNVDDSLITMIPNGVTRTTQHPHHEAAVLEPPHPPMPSNVEALSNHFDSPVHVTNEETKGVESTALTKSEEAFQAAINKRAAEDEALKVSVRQKAEEELDVFYDARVDKMALRQSENRDQEENMLEDMSKLNSELSNPWVKVCNLIDLRAQANESEDSNNSISTERMKSLLMRMKNCE